MRYVLFQIPDTAVLIVILFLLRWWTDFGSWVYGIIAGLWIIKDALMFPLVWRAYERSHAEDARSLIGTQGVAEEELNPSGYIRVHGELWQAEVIGKKGPIEKGEAVLIERVHGLTLIVHPAQQSYPL